MDRDLDAKRLRPFRITAKRMEITRDRRSTLKWAIGPLTQIEKMARAMGYLVGTRAALTPSLSSHWACSIPA